MKKLIILIVSLVFLFINIKAQNYSQLAEVISSGGSESTGSNYTNFGVIGETFVDYSVIGGNYNTSIGFLYASVIITGIDEMNFNNWINIYPNPTKDKLNIEFTDNANKIKKLSLFNILGEIVCAKEGKELNVKIIEIDLSEYKTGIYYLDLKTVEGTFRKKISIVK